MTETLAGCSGMTGSSAAASWQTCLFKGRHTRTGPPRLPDHSLTGSTRSHAVVARRWLVRCPGQHCPGQHCPGQHAPSSRNRNRSHSGGRATQPVPSRRGAAFHLASYMKLMSWLAGYLRRPSRPVHLRGRERPPASVLAVRRLLRSRVPAGHGRARLPQAAGLRPGPSANMDYVPIRRPESPRIVVNGPALLGLCTL